MTDKTPEQHLEEQYKKLTLTLDTLVGEIDTKLLFSVLVGYSSVMGERLVAAKLMRDTDIMEMFAGACADAIKPREGPAPTVFYIDGNEKLGPKH